MAEVPGGLQLYGIVIIMGIGWVQNGWNRMDGGSLPIFSVFFFFRGVFFFPIYLRVRYSVMIIVTIGYRYELLLMK